MKNLIVEKKDGEKVNIEDSKYYGIIEKNKFNIRDVSDL